MDDWMHATDGHGIASVADLRGAGLGRRTVVAMVKAGVLTPLAHGWYASGPVVDETERHILTTRAMLRSHEGRAVAGHHSALLLLGLPTLGADLGVVRLSRRTAGPTNTRPSLRVGRAVPTSFSVEPRRSPRRWPPSSTGSRRDRCPLSSPLTAPFVLGWRRVQILMRSRGRWSGSIRDPAGIEEMLSHADGRHESPG